ncbi:MAG: hypothetical protein IPG86_20280 [Chitinophagaceae bacterium]|nr:hypothetical protein [Chitinophagaceae bacterium]
MKKIVYFIGVYFLFISFICGCNNNSKIEKLLSSTEMNDLILGALKARKSGDKRFCHLLIQNADDPRTSTNLRHKGVSVYQAKMEALRIILGEEPPRKIDRTPDSVVINFFSELMKRSNL